MPDDTLHVTLRNDAARALAKNLEPYGKWSPWRDLADGRRARVKMERDDDATPDAFSDSYGAVYWSPRGTTSRPKECNGAARKITTRDGYGWWQPPTDVLSDAAALASVEKRVRGYYLEEWSFCGVVLEVQSAPCACCDERKSVGVSLWGIEDDAGDYFADVIADLLHDATN